MIGLAIFIIGFIIAIIFGIIYAVMSTYYTKNIIEKDMKICDKNNCNYGKDSCEENIVENIEQKKTKCSKDKDCSGLTGAWSCDVKLGNCIKQKNYTCFEKIYDYPKTRDAMFILFIIGVIMLPLGGFVMVMSK